MKRERVWLVDSGSQDRAYVVRVERDGSVVGWVSGGLSVVLDMTSDSIYADAVGEEADVLTAYVLTDVGPLHCVVATTAHREIGFYEHKVTWRDPMVRGRAAYQSETGYTKIIDI